MTISYKFIGCFVQITLVKVCIPKEMPFY